MSSREVLQKQNDVVISKPSALRLPQLLWSFAITLKKTFSAILVYISGYKTYRHNRGFFYFFDTENKKTLINSVFIFGFQCHIDLNLLNRIL